MLLLASIILLLKYPLNVSKQAHRTKKQLENFSEIQRLALATVIIEGNVTHARLKCMSVEHPRDLTLALTVLVPEGVGASGSVVRSTYSYFPGEPPLPCSPLKSPSAQTSEVLSPSSVPSESNLLALQTIAQPVQDKKKVTKEEICSVIANLKC
jgi:hypothetical protein